MQKGKKIQDNELKKLSGGYLVKGRDRYEYFFVVDNKGKCLGDKGLRGRIRSLEEALKLAEKEGVSTTIISRDKRKYLQGREREREYEKFFSTHE